MTVRREIIAGPMNSDLSATTFVHPQWQETKVKFISLFRCLLAADGADTRDKR
jgi:hypothetical protein